MAGEPPVVYPCVITMNQRLKLNAYGSLNVIVCLNLCSN